MTFRTGDLISILFILFISYIVSCVYCVGFPTFVVTDNVVDIEDIYVRELFDSYFFQFSPNFTLQCMFVSTIYVILVVFVITCSALVYWCSKRSVTYVPIPVHEPQSSPVPVYLLHEDLQYDIQSGESELDYNARRERAYKIESDAAHKKIERRQAHSNQEWKKRIIKMKRGNDKAKNKLISLATLFDYVHQFICMIEWFLKRVSTLGYHRFVMITDDQKLDALLIAPLLEEYVKYICPAFMFIIPMYEIFNTKTHFPEVSLFSLCGLKLLIHTLQFHVGFPIAVICHFIHNLLILCGLDMMHFNAPYHTPIFANILSNFGQTRVPIRETKIGMSLYQLTRSRDILDVVDNLFNIFMVADPSLCKDITVDDIVSIFDKSSTNALSEIRKFWSNGGYEPQDSSTMWSTILSKTFKVEEQIISNSSLWLKTIKIKAYLFSAFIGAISIGKGYTPPSWHQYMDYLENGKIMFYLGDIWDIGEFLLELKDKLLLFFTCKPADRGFAMLFSGDKLPNLLKDSLELTARDHDKQFLMERYNRVTIFDANACCIEELSSMYLQFEEYLLRLPTSHPARTVIDQRRSLVKKHRDALRSGMPLYTRKEPQNIYIYGVPATLKSDLSDYLTGVALDAMGIPEPFDKRHVYTAPLEEQAHENGYKGQSCYTIQEAFQQSVKSKNRKNIPMFLIGVTGSNPYMFNSADLESKGRNYYLAILNMLVSNLHNPPVHEDVEDAQAFYRRLHYVIKSRLVQFINGVEQIPCPDGQGYYWNPKTPTPFNKFDAYSLTLEQITVYNGIPKSTIIVESCSLADMAKYLHRAIKEKDIRNTVRAKESDDQAKMKWCPCGRNHLPDFVCDGDTSIPSEFPKAPELLQPEEPVPIDPWAPWPDDPFVPAPEPKVEYAFLEGEPSLDYVPPRMNGMLPVIDEQYGVAPFGADFFDAFRTYYMNFMMMLNTALIMTLLTFLKFRLVPFFLEAKTIALCGLNYYEMMVQEWREASQQSKKVFKIIAVVTSISVASLATYKAYKWYTQLKSPEEQLGLATQEDIEAARALNESVGAKDPLGWSKPTLQPWKVNVVAPNFTKQPESYSKKFRDILRENSVTIRFSGQKPWIEGLFLSANALLVNSHYFYQVGREGLLRISFREDSNRSMKEYLEQVSERNMRDLDNGYTIIYVQTTGVKSLAKYLLDDFTQLKSTTKLIMVNKDREVVSHHICLTPSATQAGKRITVAVASETSEVGRPGDCGSPIIAEVADGNFKIVGIHEGRFTEENRQVYLPLDLKIFNSLLNLDVNQLMYSRETESYSHLTQGVIGPVPARSVLQHIPPEKLPINIIGGIIGDANHRKAPNVSPTGVLFCLEEVKDMGNPEILNCVKPDGTYFNPHLISFGHASLSPAKEIPKAYIDWALSLFLKDIEFDSSKTINPLPIESACSGSSEYGLNGMDVSKAVGVPFRGKKDDYMKIWDPRTHQISPDARILREIKHILECYEKGISAAPIFRAALKVEVKKKGKPARQFFAGPTAFLIVCKMFLEPVFNEVRHMEGFPSMEGINCCDPEEVTKLLCKLLGCDKLPDMVPEQLDAWLRTQTETEFHKFTDSDYVKYDKINCFAYMVIRGIIEKFIVKFPNYGTKILRGIVCDLFQALCVCEGTLYEVCHQVLSGCFGVVFIQSVCEWFIKTMVHGLCYKYKFGVLPDKTLRHFASLANYGDDNLQGARADTHLTGANMARAYAELHISVTNANKEAGDLIEKSIMDVEFLKRKFYIHPDIGPVMQLDLKSIAKSLCWWIPGQEVFDARMVASSRGAQRELVYHGKKIYNSWTSQLREDFKALKLPTTHLISYEEMVELAKLPGFVTWM